MYVKFVVMRLRTSIGTLPVIAHRSDLMERPWHAQAAPFDSCHAHALLP